MALFINGEEIDGRLIAQVESETQQQMGQELQSLPPEIAQLRVKEIARERVVERFLIRQAAWERDTDLNPDELQKISEHIKKQRFGGKNKISASESSMIEKEATHQLKMDALFQHLESQIEMPGEAVLTEFYEKRRSFFTEPEQVKAAHIVKHAKTEEEAKVAETAIQEIKSELDAGKDFFEVASEKSDCPSKGGDLGWFPRGQMVPRFEAVVFEMQPNEISEPFLTEFGWHIVRLEEKKPAVLKEFEAVKESIQKELYRKAQDKVFQNFIGELKEKAKIEDK